VNFHFIIQRTLSHQHTCTFSPWNAVALCEGGCVSV
jgi:hypothetical protein